MANRIFYGCLGIAACGGPLIQGVQSVSLSDNRSVSTIFTPGKKTYAGKYSNLPDIELSYTKYADSLTSFGGEAGLSGYAGFTILAGDDTKKCLGGSGNLTTIGFKELLLSSITYTISVDGPFTVERKYKGWSSEACAYNGLGVFANCDTSIASTIKRKGCFSASSPQLYSLRHSNNFSNKLLKLLTANILKVIINVIGLVVRVKYVLKLFSHTVRSNPVLAYSALLPQVSRLVNNLNDLIFPSCLSFSTLSARRSTRIGLTPRLLLMFNSKSGNGFRSRSSRSRQVLACNNGSPPVIRKIFRVLLTVGHQAHHASTYGFVSSS